MNKIFISGTHSGQSPCAGLGIARSVRDAFPHSVLVAVDHWQGSTGLHHPAFDESLIFPKWSQIDNERHASEIRAWLDRGDLWISALDLEIRWISENLGPHPHLLIPGGSALEKSAKPAAPGLENLGLRVPEAISASSPDEEIHAFLRHSSCQCWLKSPYHDARRVSSWASFQKACEALGRNWRTSKLFLQRNVLGNEESIAFCAYQGELLGAVHLVKRLVTAEGKTWAGRVTPVKPEIFERLADALRRMEWSGGGEIEYVRDPDDQSWFIECNPRFPAWIHGAALVGMNLPAKLVSRVRDWPFLEAVSRFTCFTRVVQEIPAKEEVGLPWPQDPGTQNWIVDGGKGKGGSVDPEALPRLRENPPQAGEEDGGAEEPLPDPSLKVPEAFATEVSSVANAFRGETPSRVLLPEWCARRFEHVAKNVLAANRHSPRIRIGYSVKTSPTPEHLALARKHGFLAECISQLEIRRALEAGYQPAEMILNGPGKFWPTSEPPVTGLHLLFCDSLEELERVLKMPGPVANTLGFRMRLPDLPSRFGNRLDQFEIFDRMVSCTQRLGKKARLGFHFHMPSWSIGVDRWMEALEALLLWCRAVEHLSGVRVRTLDLGGGFFPQDLERLDFADFQAKVGDGLPEVEDIFFEPGRALTQDTEVLISRVLDVRRNPDGKPSDIVVDASLAELPLAQLYQHRIFFLPSGGTDASPLGKGGVRILGRICMEDDILNAGVSLPDSVELGDFIVVGDAGAYERSMSYVFLGAASREHALAREGLNGRTSTALRSLIENEKHLIRWIEHPSSSIVMHEAECCERARAWFLALARSMEIGTLSRFRAAAPSWLSQRFKWGPSVWPISWCEVVRSKVIDCGVFAALTREIFTAQGNQAHPAQALISYNAVCTDHWQDLWKKGMRKLQEKQLKSGSRSGEIFPWIGSEVVYHELVVLELPDGAAKVYDSSWGLWYEPQSRTGFGSLLALRTECPRLLQWGTKTLSCGEWMEL